MQSFTSVFQPGTAFMWCALAKTTSKLPSRRLKTGFQYTLGLHVCTPRATAHHTKAVPGWKTDVKDCTDREPAWRNVAQGVESPTLFVLE